MKRIAVHFAAGLLLVALLVVQSFAANLTGQQLADLKAAIVADSALNSLPINDDTSATIAAALNAKASPGYFAWRTSVPKNEYTQGNGIGTDGTTVTSFDWASTGGYISRSQAERDAWREVFNGTNTANPSKGNLRLAFEDIFSGNGAGAIANRAHISAVGRRTVTRFEKIYVIATVGGPAQTGNRGAATNPDTLVIEGNVTGDQVRQARELP